MQGGRFAHGSETLPDGLYMRVEVRDDGCGMSADMLDHVTAPFFTTKPSGQGSGLGLSMAMGFAEQSGGALVLDSVPGQGTVVALILPLAESALR